MVDHVMRPERTSYRGDFLSAEKLRSSTSRPQKRAGTGTSSGRWGRDHVRVGVLADVGRAERVPVDVRDDLAEVVGHLALEAGQALLSREVGQFVTR